MNRRNAILLLVFVAVIVGCTVWYLSRTATSFSFHAPATAVIGEEIAVALALDSDTYTVTASELTFTYDAQRLQLVSLAPGSLLPAVLVPASLGNGRAAITLGSGTTASSGPGTLAILTFKVTAAGDALVALDPASGAAAAGESANVLHAVHPVTIRVH